MIAIPVNSNSICIRTVPTASMKEEFDSTYPTHLNGIISQDEFRESIGRINRIMSPNSDSKVLAVILILIIIIGLILIITGKGTAMKSGRSGYSPLVLIGVGIIVLGILTIGIGCYSMGSGRLVRLRQVINEESMKYLSRPPIPCSWRLYTQRKCVDAHGHHNSQIVYKLVIDIGRPDIPENGTHSSNQVVSVSAILSEQQGESAPPPYPGQPAGFCSQCGAPRQDITAKFCSSCSHSLNKY